MKFRLARVLAIALLLTGCGSTTFNATWKNPDAKELSFKQGDPILAIVVSTHETVRRSAEDALAHELTLRGLKGIPGYTVLPMELTKDAAAAEAAVTKSGAVGVVSMRALKVGKQVSSSGPTMYAGPTYGTYWGGGYYGRSWGYAYDPGYIRTDTIVTVETLVYDLRQDKLVWGGQSETMNPDKIDTFIKELVDEVAAELHAQGLVR